MNRRKKYANAEETLIRIGAMEKFITSLMGKTQDYINELVAEGEQVDASLSADSAKDDLAQDENGGTNMDDDADKERRRPVAEDASDMKKDLPHPYGIQIAKHLYRAKKGCPEDIANLIQARTNYAEIGKTVALAKTHVFDFLNELMDEEIQEEEINEDKKVTEIKQDAENSKS